MGKRRKLKSVDPFNIRRQAGEEDKKQSKKPKNEAKLPYRLRQVIKSIEDQQSKPGKPSKKKKEKDTVSAFFILLTDQEGESYVEFSKRIRDYEKLELQRPVDLLDKNDRGSTPPPDEDDQISKRKLKRKMHQREKQKKKRKTSSNNSEDEYFEDKVEFGEQVDRPPEFSVLPKARKLKTQEQLKNSLAQKYQQTQAAKILLKRAKPDIKQKVTKPKIEKDRVSQNEMYLEVLRQKARINYAEAKKRSSSQTDSNIDRVVNLDEFE